MVFQRNIVIFAALALLGQQAAAAPSKYGITAEEKAACQTDAAAYCSATFPDEDKLIACMKGNKAQLSPMCLQVFTAGLRRRHML